MFLAACIIEKYPENDLFRYFFPQELSQKKNRPEYLERFSKMDHWFQLIACWFRQLFNKPICKLNSEGILLTESSKQLKISLNKKSYVENSMDVDFRAHLSKVLIQLKKKRINSKFEDHANQGIIEREKMIVRREGELEKKENLFYEQQKQLIDSQKNLREQSHLLNNERKDYLERIKHLEKENGKLKEATLKKEKFNDKTYIRYLGDNNFQLEKDLKKLTKKLKVFQTNSEPKLYRSQSHASFFPEQPAKNNDSNLPTTKSLECLTR